LKDPDQVIGQVAANPIKKGEQLLANKLLNPGPDTGISFQVTPSKRALTIPIDEVRGVARLIRPGDRVDIIAAIDVGRGVNAKREVITMLTDVPILATGLNVRNNIPRTFELDPGNNNVTQVNLSGDTRFSTVTIEVSPKEAQDLVYLLATSPGSIFFTVKHPHDRQTFQRLPASSAESILGRPLAEAAPLTPSMAQPGAMPPRVPR
jgi:pilus assembly protein CpaB